MTEIPNEKQTLHATFNRDRFDAKKCRTIRMLFTLFFAFLQPFYSDDFSKLNFD